MIAFINWAIKKNEILENSGVALRTGARRVLETDESLFDTDMRTLDVEDVIRRFRNKQRGGDFKEASVDDYARRFKQSVEMYVKWLSDDASWRPPARKAAPAKAQPKNGGQSKAAQPAASAQAVVPSQPTPATGVTPVTPVGVEMVKYPFLVRPGVRVHVELPADLTAKEADRVAKFVASLAFEERLAITAGPATE
jgi:hypothetical protein